MLVHWNHIVKVRIQKFFILEGLVEQKISLLPLFNFITSTATNTKAPFSIMNVSMVEKKGGGTIEYKTRV